MYPAIFLLTLSLLGCLITIASLMTYVDSLKREVWKLKNPF